MTSSDVFIVGARRTPIGSLGGMLSAVPAHRLGATAIAAALEDAGVPADLAEDVLMGQVLTAGAGMNPGRQAARAAGLPDQATATTVNQVCGSGLKAVGLASRQILADDMQIAVAGGQESMSLAPHLAVLRPGRKLGDITLRDTVMSDGLSDAFYGYPMGVTAENIARRHNISREDQDAFALQSQRRASAASMSGRFQDEIVAVDAPVGRDTVSVTEDEHIRRDVSLATLAGLKPAFESDGTVTAGNASGINDGAAALVLASGTAVAKHRMSPLVRIAGFAQTGLDPQVMGLGPITASPAALKRAGWTIDSVDLWELNEAFAAQSIAVRRELKLDPEKVNVNGGAIALGHPIGASGARILVTLIHEMLKRRARRGVASLCIGGGMGIAMCIELA